VVEEAKLKTEKGKLPRIRCALPAAGEFWRGEKPDAEKCLLKKAQERRTENTGGSS